MPLSGWVNGNERIDAEHCYGLLVTPARSVNSNEHVHRTFMELIAQYNARHRTPVSPGISCAILKVRDPVQMGGDRVTHAHKRSFLQSSILTVP